MSMFCFQCEQTAFHKACTQKGVCGKDPDIANLQDKLTSSVIELANCGNINDENTKLIIDGLFTTITNVNFDNKSIENLTEKFKNRISCDFKFDVKDIWDCSEDLRSLKSLILFGLKGMAAYALASVAAKASGVHSALIAKAKPAAAMRIFLLVIVSSSCFIVFSWFWSTGVRCPGWTV